MRGFHHVSLITKNRHQNRQFYEDILGLRLVKQSYHQENRRTPHLFYGDYEGTIGTLVSFFEFPSVGKSYWGKDRVSHIALQVPSYDSVLFWYERLKKRGIEITEPESVFGTFGFSFEDFDHSKLRIVESKQRDKQSHPRKQRHKDIPLEHEIIGLGPIELKVSKLPETIAFLTDVFRMNLVGFYPQKEYENKYVYVLETDDMAQLHVEDAAVLPKQKDGSGSVDHIAFHAEDIEAWEKYLDDMGILHSGVIDRYYFKSIYVEDPSGINFELSTSEPGFLLDEELENLGRDLKKL